MRGVSGIWITSPARAALVYLIIASAGGCAGPAFEGGQTSLTVQEPDTTKYIPSTESYNLGQEHFRRGDFGMAERYFRQAVELTPRDAPAWIGLAASYDRLRRFDLADRAYEKAIAIAGETPEILNNLGYSHLLRGNLKTARTKFLKACERDPANPVPINNLKLLDESSALLKN